MGLHEDIVSLDDCKSTCASAHICKGIEYHADLQRCEVWKQTINTSVHAKGFLCFRHSMITTTTTTVAAKQMIDNPQSFKNGSTCPREGDFCHDAKCCEGSSLRCFARDEHLAVCQRSC